MGKKNILLAIPSFLDPEIPGNKKNRGPILQILHDGSFDEVILFGLQIWRMNLFLTEQAIRSKFPKITIHRSLLPIDDLFIYKDVFSKLKSAFLSYDAYLKMHCEEPVVLLPPSSYSCLFDCWLLLTTSLNSKIRLCKVEPHYSLEGVFAKNSVDKHFSCFAEDFTDFQDVINDRVPTAIPQLSNQQVKYLTHLLSKKENFCLQIDKTVSIEALSQFLLQYTHFQGSNFLKINCEFIPQEICDPLFWGYSKEIEDHVKIERKGLLQRLKRGWLLLLNANNLPEKISKDMIQLYKRNVNCHFVNLITSSQPHFSDLPLYTLGAVVK